MLQKVAGAGGLALALTLALTAVGSAEQRGIDWTLPQNTAVPIEFTHTLKAGKLRAGDPVKARTMQVIHLGQGHDLPKGSLVLGEIVMAQPVHRGVSPSTLSFKFDRIETREGIIPVHLYLRALANVHNSEDASYPTPPADMNLSNSRMLIGGDEVIPFERKVYNGEGDEADLVGEDLKDGVFERLRPAQAMDSAIDLTCDGTAMEQSVAIFSGTACGLYGFDAVHLTHVGKQSKGIIELNSKYYTITLYSLSTALLQVAPEQNDLGPQI